MNADNPPEYLRLGQWLVKLSEIAAIGPNEQAETCVVLNCGFRLALTRDEARELLAILEPDADWRK